MIMRERGILFSGEMVRAILDGRKTQTRRPLRREFSPEPARICHWKDDQWTLESNSGKMFLDSTWQPFRCPYGQPGDRLWVRETWAEHPDGEGPIYRATDPGWDDEDTGLRWRPSIHMSRRASRLTLEITDVRVQRVQEIDHRDALAEGVSWDMCNSPVSRFYDLWEQTYHNWHDNPWVWAITFRRIP